MKRPTDWRKAAALAALFTPGGALAQEAVPDPQPVLKFVEPVAALEQATLLEPPTNQLVPGFPPCPEGACSTCSRPAGQCGCQPRGLAMRHHWHTHTVPKLEEQYWGYPAEFYERPFGVPVRRALNRQIANGLAAQMVLYEFDFVDASHAGGNPADLTSRGKLQVAKIVDRMKLVSAPIMIEPSGNPQLDTARREQVAAYLRDQLQFPLSPESIVTAAPLAAGLAGADAVRNYDNLLLQTERGGAFIPTDEERSTIGFGASGILPDAAD